MKKCPLHDRELVYVETQRMECPVKGCDHAVYTTTPTKDKRGVVLPWWAIVLP